MKHRKIVGVVLALALLAASLWGCAAAGSPENTPQPSGGTTATAEAENPAQTTAPAELNGLSGITVATIPATGSLMASQSKVSQQRLRNMPSGWPDAFNTDEGCFLVADSVSGLAEALSRRGGLDEKLDLDGFDDAFFREYRLVVIPRCSNSGSVRYEAVIFAEATSVQITLQGSMEGDGTGDMADWLVFVALPLEDYPAEMTITVTGSAGNAGSNVTS